MACPQCDGTCAAGPLDGLVTDDLAWFWAQLAAAGDRLGDPRLVTGSVTITVVDDVAGRTAAAGLLGRTHLRPAKRVRVDLAALAERITPLTPGAVAAHACGRRLGLRAAARNARAASEEALRSRIGRLIPAAASDASWAALRRTGWVTRILKGAEPRLLERAAAVMSRLPPTGEPALDRRLLAQRAAMDPHELDAGRLTGGLVLAVLAATGRSEPGVPARAAWASVGVNYDDIIGGLTVVGIAPLGWTIPDGAPVTLPPRVLRNCSWPTAAGAVVFVTENPSVLGAAAAIIGARVVCTSGTPSRIEVDALGRLAHAGWSLRVRADFDDAGLTHVRSILKAAPSARVWRMGVADYVAGLTADEPGVALRAERIGKTPWDPPLRNAMIDHGVAVFEESLLEELLADIASP